MYAEKKSKKRSEHKAKKEEGVDEVDAGKTVIPNKAAVEHDGEEQPQAKPVHPLGQSQSSNEKKVDSYVPQTKPVFSLGQTQPVDEKKADLRNLPQTPTTSAAEKQQLPPPAPEKKVYPKEKHPKATESPKFGRKLVAAPPPGKEKPSVKPEPVVKAYPKEKYPTREQRLLAESELKRLETKPTEVGKPVEKAFSPHRKAPELPKPKVKVMSRAY